MIAFQGLCLVIVGLHLARSSPQERREFAFLVPAAWVTEDTCIRFYEFYRYASQWDLFVDQVPLIICLIWPVVIQTAARLVHGRWWMTGLVVVTDAALIEPIAVAAGLWHWQEPVIFDVPVIGILGWGLFAAAAIGSRNSPLRLLVGVPVATHGALLVLWWGALRWVSAPVPDVLAVAVVWVLSLGVTVGLRSKGVRLPVGLVATRVPSALVFLGLLCFLRPPWPLWAWAAAFTVPYLVTLQRRSVSESA
jgi:hypothetical protein